MLLKDKNYFLYISALFITFFGNGLYFIGIVWLLYDLTESVSSIGFFFIANLLPGLIFSPIGGVIADKFNRKKAMIVTDILRGVIVIGIVMLSQANLLIGSYIFIVTFLVGSIDKFFFPASSGLLRQIVNDDLLFKANSYKNSCIQLGLILGNAFGGVLIAFAEVNFVIVANALTYFLSAICIALIGVKPSPIMKNKKMKVIEALKEYYVFFIEGLIHIKERPNIIAFISVNSLLEVILRSLNILLLPFVLEVLFLDSEAFGLIDAAFGIGAVLGGMLSGIMLKRIGEKKFVPSYLLSMAAALFLFSISTNIIVPIITYFAIGFSLVQISSYITSQIQQNISQEFQGRISSTVHFLLSIIAILATLSMGILGDKLSLRVIFCFLGGLMFVNALWVVFLTKSKKILGDKQPSYKV